MVICGWPGKPRGDGAQAADFKFYVWGLRGVTEDVEFEIWVLAHQAADLKILIGALGITGPILGAPIGPKRIFQILNKRFGHHGTDPGSPDWAQTKI